MAGGSEPARMAKGGGMGVCKFRPVFLSKLWPGFGMDCRWRHGQPAGCAAGLACPELNGCRYCSIAAKGPFYDGYWSANFVLESRLKDDPEGKARSAVGPFGVFIHLAGEKPDKKHAHAHHECDASGVRRSRWPARAATCASCACQYFATGRR